MIGCKILGWAGRLIATIAIMLVLAHGAAAQTPAAPPAPPPGMTQQQFDALVGAISAAVVQQLTDRGLIPAPLAADAAPAAATVEDDPVREMSRQFVLRLGAVLAAAPEIGTSLARAAEVLSEGERGFFGFVLLLTLVIGGGLGAEWVIRRALDGAKRSLAGAAPPTLARLAALALLDGLAIAGFYGAAHALDAVMFAGAAPQSRLAGFLLAAVLTWRVFALAFRILLRPDLPVARIAPVSDAAAGPLYRKIEAALFVFMAVRTWISFLLVIRTPVDAVAAASLVNNVIAVTVLLTVVWTSRAAVAPAFAALVEGQGRPAAAKLALARNWAWIATALVAVMSAAQAYGIVSGRLAAGRGIIMTLIAIIALIFAEFLFCYMVRRSRALQATTDAPAAPGVTELLARCLRMAAWITALVIVAQTWAVDVLGLVDQGAWRSLARSSVSAGATLFLAFIAWETVKFATNRYTAQYQAGPTAPDHEGEGQPPPNTSRLRTLMPLLRIAFAVVIVVLAVLIVLSEIGINVAPLIAGASVVGLAISFGSQSLVRDIVSGIFYLADDAFRVGEYIDVGKAKGTVEGFTLRSIKMRHQNGQVHTIPFGQLGQITNFSRDWTTVKFNLRLARATDIELVRKTVKKIGQEMLEDPEIKAEVIEPLKMQGIADITDTALVARFKFTCRPGKPTLIQRQAIKRMVGVFPTKGIEFATATVSVTTTGGGADPAAIAAANAAMAPPVAPTG